MQGVDNSAWFRRAFTSNANTASCAGPVVTGYETITGNATTAFPSLFQTLVDTMRPELTDAVRTIFSIYDGLGDVPACTPIAITPEANARARALLEQVLPAAELERWDRERIIIVPSRRIPGAEWRIAGHLQWDGPPGIGLWIGGRSRWHVCLTVGKGLLPNDDVAVAKYLLCAFAEDEVSRIGNWTRAFEIWPHEEPQEAPPVALPAELVFA
jgi:hypothetical protein